MTKKQNAKRVASARLHLDPWSHVILKRARETTPMMVTASCAVRCLYFLFFSPV
jgi:hypothetical protein